MSVMRPRTKMISFRLSEPEYDNLMELCVSCGSRSLSDLARDAVYRLMNNGGRAGRGLEKEIYRLRGRITELEGEVKRLAQLMEQA